jgi:hypothetical protein
MSRPQPVITRLIALCAGVAWLTGCSSTAGRPAKHHQPAALRIASLRLPSSPMSEPCQLSSTSLGQISMWNRSVRHRKVVKTYNDLGRTTGTRQRNRVDAVVAAENKFPTTVNDVPDDLTLTQAAASLCEEAVNVPAALSGLRDLHLASLPPVLRSRCVNGSRESK